jgi:hypothetical protein
LGDKDLASIENFVPQEEFIRRFSLHILPKGFNRIRHYSILSGTWKRKNLKVLFEI